MVSETYHPKLAWKGLNLKSRDCETDDGDSSCIPTRGKLHEILNSAD